MGKNLYLNFSDTTLSSNFLSFPTEIVLDILQSYSNTLLFATILWLENRKDIILGVTTRH